MSIEKFIENFDELTKEFSKDTSLVFEKVDSANNTKFRVCYVTPKVPCKMFLCLKYTTKYSSIDVVREVIKNFKNKNDENVNKYPGNFHYRLVCNVMHVNSRTIICTKSLR